MDFRQYPLFEDKSSFNPSDFEKDSNRALYLSIVKAVETAFNRFSVLDIQDFDSTTRSNMLNNLVVSEIERTCSADNFKFIKSMGNTRRSYAVFDDQYMILFKKCPVSNIKTVQDDRLKYQEMAKHVIFLTYDVDAFWSEIKKIEFQYFSDPKTIEYAYDVTHLTEMNIVPNPILVPEVEEMPKVAIKQGILKISKAE